MSVQPPPVRVPHPVTMGVRVPAVTATRLRHLAELHEISLSHTVRWVIHEGLRALSAAEAAG